jgi:hypothetical protein
MWLESPADQTAQFQGMDGNQKSIINPVKHHPKDQPMIPKIQL